MARDFDKQVTGLQIRSAVLNHLTALNAPQAERVECLRSTEGKTRPQADVCNKARKECLTTLQRKVR